MALVTTLNTSRFLLILCFRLRTAEYMEEQVMRRFTSALLHRGHKFWLVRNYKSNVLCAEVNEFRMVYLPF
jgi:hypothetical protein